MSVFNWLTLAVLLLAGYLSTVHHSLIALSHSAFMRRFRAKGRETAGVWLLDRRDALRNCVSLLLAAARVTFIILVLVDLIDPKSTITATNLGVAGAIGAVLLWLFTGVLASALARHAGPAVLAGSGWLLQGLTWFGMPLAGGLGFIDEIVRRLAGVQENGDDHAEQELLRTIEESQRQGGIDAEAAELLENVVEFRSTDVGEVMTPRTDIDGIELTDDLSAIRERIVELGHSRIPVFEENLDHIVGILYVKDLVPYLGEEAADFRLEPLLRQPIRVPVTKFVGDLLADFQRAEVHMALVVDEYGGTEGLVTIEDVLEELVGEIQDEHDSEAEEPPGLSRIDETHAEVDGRYHIDDLNEELELDLPEEEEFDTIAGYVLARLGRVPEVGDSFEDGKARFTALEATPTHVAKIGIELLASSVVNGERG